MSKRERTAGGAGCGAHRPSSSLMVAYCELARGHAVRLHRPVRLYSLRQKVCVVVFTLKEQKRWLITCGAARRAET